MILTVADCLWWMWTDFYADDEAVFSRLAQVPWLAWFEDRDPHGNPVDVLKLCDDTLGMTGFLLVVHLLATLTM